MEILTNHPPKANPRAEIQQEAVAVHIDGVREKIIHLRFGGDVILRGRMHRRRWQRPRSTATALLAVRVDIAMANCEPAAVQGAGRGNRQANAMKRASETRLRREQPCLQNFEGSDRSAGHGGLHRAPPL